MAEMVHPRFFNDVISTSSSGVNIETGLLWWLAWSRNHQLERSPTPSSRTRGWGISVSRSGEPYVSVVTGTITITRQFRVNSRTNEVSEGPTKRPRARAIIFLHPATVARLKARRAQQNGEKLKMGRTWPTKGLSAGLIFTWPTGEYIHPSVATRIVTRMTVEAGLPRLTPHGLRHSFATAALSARVPVEVVAARLGDTPRVIQETYAHVLPADDEAAAKAVGDLFRGGPGPSL
jgi:hypothetical protein